MIEQGPNGSEIGAPQNKYISLVFFYLYVLRLKRKAILEHLVVHFNLNFTKNETKNNGYSIFAGTG